VQQVSCSPKSEFKGFLMFFHIILTFFCITVTSNVDEKKKYMVIIGMIFLFIHLISVSCPSPTSHYDKSTATVSFPNDRIVYRAGQSISYN